MIINIIKYALITLITSFLMMYLNSRANKKIKPSINGRFELRLNKFYWYIGLGSIIFGFIGFILASLYIENEKAWIYGLFFFLLFGGVGSISSFWYVNHKFRFDSKRIESISVYGKKETLEWNEIQSIKFHALSSLLVFKNNSGRKVKAHQHLIGFGELLNAMENNTKWKIKDLKIPYR